MSRAGEYLKMRQAQFSEELDAIRTFEEFLNRLRWHGLAPRGALSFPDGARGELSEVSGGELSTADGSNRQ